MVELTTEGMCNTRWYTYHIENLSEAQSFIKGHHVYKENWALNEEKKLKACMEIQWTSSRCAWWRMIKLWATKRMEAVVFFLELNDQYLSARPTWLTKGITSADVTKGITEETLKGCKFFLNWILHEKQNLWNCYTKS